MKNMFKVKTETPERRRRRSGVFIVNFEHISHIFLAFLILPLRRYLYNWYLVKIIWYLAQIQKTLYNFSQYAFLSLILCLISSAVLSCMQCNIPY